MTTPSNVGTFVVTGTTIEKNDDDSLGRGVAEVKDGVVDTVVGTLNREDGVLFGEQKTDPIREIEIGDVVIGEVNRINPKTAEIRILHVEGKPVRTLPASHLFADIFVAKIVDKFMPSPGDAMRKRDLIRAKIEQLSPMLRAECRSHDDLGVIKAICPACGEYLVASSDVPDVNVVDLVVYNLMGQKVRRLVNGEIQAGYHRVVWDCLNDRGEPVSTGVYIYSLTSPSFHNTKKMVLLK
mgnify:CR=1 FL=1